MSDGGGMYYLSNESNILKVSLRNKRINAGVKSTQVNIQGALKKGFYLNTELLTQPITQLGFEPMISCTATIEQNPSGMS